MAATAKPKACVSSPRSAPGRRPDTPEHGVILRHRSSGRHQPLHRGALGAESLHLEADFDEIIAAVRRGHQTLESIHQLFLRGVRSGRWLRASPVLDSANGTRSDETVALTVRCFRACASPHGMTLDGLGAEEHSRAYSSRDWRG